MLPNVPPKLFSFSAIIVGYILIDDMTSNEQNALGNWLMLVAQVLSTNAFYKAVMQERGLDPKDNLKTMQNMSDFFSNNNENSNEKDTTIVMLKKMICALQKEVDEIKKSM